jgi:hypothetical protein
MISAICLLRETGTIGSHGPIAKESIIYQIYFSKISPDPSFPKRGNSSLL